MNPIEERKMIEKEIGDLGRGRYLGSYIYFDILDVKLKVYKEWEQREKEIIEMIDDWHNDTCGGEMKEEVKKLKQKIKGEK